MSELFAAHIHSRGRARSHERHRPRDRFELLMRRILWAAIIILLLFSFGEMIFNFFVSPNVVIRKIEIKNDLGIPENELIALAGMNRNEYYFSVDCAGIE
ncbi:MAG TPA: hypothetical protein ENN69_01870, partial [Spirochaetia bacterium]|nr:hypothetical protein [Spirochaetia bacterium]